MQPASPSVALTRKFAGFGVPPTTVRKEALADFSASHTYFPHRRRAAHLTGYSTVAREHMCESEREPRMLYFAFHHNSTVHRGDSHRQKTIRPPVQQVPVKHRRTHNLTSHEYDDGSCGGVSHNATPYSLLVNDSCGDVQVWFRMA